jgi:hypothetical protein
MLRRTAVLFVVLAIVSLGGASALAAPKSPFKPGLYVGKTSQGKPVKLRLSVGGEACKGKPCLFAPNPPSEIYIGETCSGEGSANEYLALSGNAVPKSGVVKLNEQSFSKTVATLKVGHNGTLTGKVRDTITLEDGEKCDSGNVTFTAKIGGSTK